MPYPLMDDGPWNAKNVVLFKRPMLLVPFYSFILLLFDFFFFTVASARQWKLLSYFVALPGIALCMLNVYLQEKDAKHERPEFIKYEYMRIRNKVRIS